MIRYSFIRIIASLCCIYISVDLPILKLEPVGSMMFGGNHVQTHFGSRCLALLAGNACLSVVKTIGDVPTTEAAAPDGPVWQYSGR